MFAYCRNNPVRRIDASGTLDYEAADCDADGDLREDIGFLPGGQSNATTVVKVAQQSIDTVMRRQEQKNLSQQTPTLNGNINLVFHSLQNLSLVRQ